MFESLLAFIDYDNGLIAKLTKLSKGLRLTVQNLLRHKTILSVDAYHQAYEQFSTVKRTWLTLTEVSHGCHRLDRVLLCQVHNSWSGYLSVGNCLSLCL